MLNAINFLRWYHLLLQRNIGTPVHRINILYIIKHYNAHYYVTFLFFLRLRLYVYKYLMRLNTNKISTSLFAC